MVGIAGGVEPAGQPGLPAPPAGIQAQPSHQE